MATPVTGLDLAGFFTPEATFDTNLAAAATDAVAFNEFKIVPEQDWIKSEEHAQSASLQTEIEGLRGGTWNVSSYIKPAAAGTAPDINDLLEAAGFTGTNSPGTSEAYALNASNPSGLQCIKSTGVLYEVINGAWIENVAIEITGNQPPTIDFSGRFATHGALLGDPTIASGSGTSITLTSGDEFKVGVNARVKFDTEDNSGAGYLVTAVSADGGTLTITPTLAGAVASPDAVLPVIPASTTGGTPQGGIACGLTIGGVAAGFMDFKLNYGTGTTGLDKEATANRANRIVRGMRTVEGTLKFYFLDESAGHLGQAWNGTTKAIVLRVGPNTAGSRCTITMPAARLSVAEIETPGNEAAVFEASFVARQSAAANDELNILFH